MKTTQELIDELYDIIQEKQEAFTKTDNFLTKLVLLEELKADAIILETLLDIRDQNDKSTKY